MFSPLVVIREKSPILGSKSMVVTFHQMTVLPLLYDVVNGIGVIGVTFHH